MQHVFCSYLCRAAVSFYCALLFFKKNRASVVVGVKEDIAATHPQIPMARSRWCLVSCVMGAKRSPGPLIQCIYSPFVELPESTDSDPFSGPIWTYLTVHNIGNLPRILCRSL